MSSESKKPIGKDDKHFIVVYNLRAGRKKEKVRSRIRSFFDKRNLSYEIVEGENYNWDEIVRKTDKYDEVRFIAAGGDGTLRGVFQELWEKDSLEKYAVAFLPLGSANITALSFRLPFGLTRALHKAVSGRATRVDLGLVNNKHIFFIMVSFGIASRVVVDTKRHMKKRFGALAYLTSIPSLFMHSYDKEKFEVSSSDLDNEEMHSIIICNHLNIAGVTPARGIAPNDKSLHCITLHNKTAWGFLKGAYDFYLTSGDSEVLKHRRIQNENYIFKNFSGEVHIDGDEFTGFGNDVEFRVLPHAAKLVT